MLMTLVVMSGLWAQSTVEPWTAEDFASLVSVNAVQLSADGRLALFELSQPDTAENLRRTSLFLSRDGSAPRQLLFSSEDCADGRIAPDGTALVFLSARKPAPAQGPQGPDDASSEDTKTQVWILPLSGGEARCLSAFPQGVTRAEWCGARTLLVVARERLSAAETEAKATKDDAMVVEGLEDWAATAEHVFRLDLDEHLDLISTTRLTEDSGRIAELVPAPDGTRCIVARITSPQHEVDERDPPVITLLDTSTGRAVEIFGERKNRPLEFSWQPDGQAFFALLPRSTDDGVTTAAVLDLVRWQGSGIEAIDLGNDAGAQPGTLAALNDGCLLLLMQGCVPRPVRVFLGQGKPLVEDVRAEVPGHIHQWVRAEQSSQVLFVEGTAARPDHWHLASLSRAQLKDARLVYEPCASLATRRFADARVIRWVGAEKQEVEGILYSPPDAGERPLPLVVMPHGGPFAQDYDRFEEGYAYAPQLYCQRGARVLYVNYHGSSGYGLAFGESIRGRYYELELIDILAGIETLVSAGLVDANALAAAGWSNGAILSTALVSMADVFAPQYQFRFKACIDGAGDVYWPSDYGNCAFGVVFDDFYLGGPPWKRPAEYIKKSPLFHAEKVTTPTLIFFGTEDTSVPTEQGHQWHRALQQLGQAPVRMLLFQGEEHGLRKPASQLRKLREEIAFMERHFFANSKEALPLAKGAPLERLLSGGALTRALVGVPSGTVLVPETVLFAGAQVGVYEVTFAQWQSVFPERAIPAGRENYPVCAVSAEDALEYVARLSRRTGHPWRLLSVEEHKALPCGPDENDLAWWAGFEPSHGEAELLRSRIADIDHELTPALVEAVGQRRGGAFSLNGKSAFIHDAGGNVAEWCMDEDGRPCVVGASACTLMDITGEAEIAPKRWVGLRVAAGEAKPPRPR
jgi:dipeptidyl aminopeptidase/acylaminoacyl peptidase